MDCIVIGCGLSGAVVARELADRGKKVIILERRSHIAGNLYDYQDEHGIWVHKYGPHIFHTSKKELYDYVCRYADWSDYRLVCGAEIDYKYSSTPFNFQTIDDFYPKQDAEELKKRICQYFGSRSTATVIEVLESSDELIRAYGQFLFEKDYSLYTAKQWGISPSEIDISILKRVPLRFSYEEGYFEDTYEALPTQGYTHFIENMLDHPNISIKLESEALKELDVDVAKQTVLFKQKPVSVPIVYTGALDELFKCSKGGLPYRSLRFEWKYEDIDSKQNAPVVAYPQEEKYTRITEYKKLPVQNVKGTTYGVEYPIPYVPQTGTEPYYPVLTKNSQEQYALYHSMAEQIPNLYCCGRLADFKYYNMDQAIEEALKCSNRIKF